MAAGNFHTRRNAALTATMPNGGSAVNLGWDVLVDSDGSIVSYTAPNLQVDIGLYLVMYSEVFYTPTEVADSSNRIEIQCEIQENSVTVGGYGSDYMRQDTGQFEIVVSGYMFLDVTADNTDLKVIAYRTDDSAEIVTRKPGYGGITILQMDATHNFGFASTSASEATATTAVRTLALNTSEQMDTGFSLASNQITVPSTGQYLATYSMDVSQAATGRELVEAALRLNAGSDINGTRAYAYMRGTDSTQNSALTWIGVLNLTAGDDIDVRWSSPSNATVTAAAGARLQLWEIPSGSGVAIKEATTGNYNTTADFAWDTVPLATGGKFGTPTSVNMSVTTNDHVLAFATFSHDIDAVQRAYPEVFFKRGGIVQSHVVGGAYFRDSSTDGGAVTAAGLLSSVAAATILNVATVDTAGTGTQNTNDAQWAVISLESIFGPYSYVLPIGVTDVDTNEVVGNAQTGVVVTGSTFEAVQGTGLVELADSADYGTATKVTQTVTSWSDISITINIVAGALANTNAYLFVTSDSGGRGSILVQVGLPPETYTEAIANMAIQPDHHWTFQNTYNDEFGTAIANNSSGGTPTFVTSPLLVKGDTHSLLINSATEYISPADQPDMNVTISANRRYMGGWILLDKISKTLTVIWEEGAQVNNFALLNGFGNNAIFQFADAAGDYVQAYFDVPLTPNRPYHILAEFNSSTQKSGICGVHLDGVFQSRSDGNPWEVTTFPSHSGNITWGHEGTEDLKVGDDRGVDATIIEFTSPVSCNYAHWYSWSNVTLNNATDIRLTLFEKGAPAEEVIVGGTEAAMQTAMDLLADTLYPDWPCSIEVQSCPTGNFELSMDNITFEDRVSIQVRYVGADTLTLVAANGSSLDPAKISTPYSGTVVIQNPATLTLLGVINGAEVRIYDNELVNTGNNDTELAGVESNSGTSFNYSHSGAANDIVVQMMAAGFEEIRLPVTLGSSDQTITLNPKVENNE